MALEMFFDTIEKYSQLEKGSFQRVDQLNAELLVNPALSRNFCYTADGNGYFLREDGGVDWAITTEDENLILRHLNDQANSSWENQGYFYDKSLECVTGRSYRPDNAEAQAAKDAKSTVVVDMSKLRFCLRERECAYLRIRTKDGFISDSLRYLPPNEEEQKVMTRLGYTSEVLKTLNYCRLFGCRFEVWSGLVTDSKGNISKYRRGNEQERDKWPVIKSVSAVVFRKTDHINIYMLNPKYVEEEVRKNHKQDSLWRASSLNRSYENHVFDACRSDFNQRGYLLVRTQ